MSIESGDPGVNKDTFLADVSPGIAYFRLYMERIAPPKIERPTWEYDRQSADFTNINTTKRIDQSNSELSIKASHAFQAWITEGYMDLDDDSEQGIKKLENVNELLDREELTMLAEYKAEYELELNKLLEEEELKARLAEEESIGFKYKPSNQTHYPKFMVNSLGRRYDLCAGKHKIKHITTVSASKVEPSVYSVSHQELTELIRRSDFETSISRVPYQGNDFNHCFPNTGIRDDPDFVPPSETSTLFGANPPAYRKYDITYRVYREDKNGKLFDTKCIPNSKNGKDYTTPTSFKYMLEQRNVAYKKIEIVSSRKELDIRLSYGNAIDYTKYLKVPPESSYGRAFIRLLMGSANSHGKLHETTVETTEIQEVKDYLDRPKLLEKDLVKVVLFTKITVKEKPAIMWIYLDQGRVGTLRSVFRTKRVGPQTEDLYLIARIDDKNNDVRRVNIGFKLRLDATIYGKNAKGETYDYDTIIRSYLTNFPNYKLVKRDLEPNTDSVFIHTFLKKNCLTKHQRRELLL